jgi:hypothetical protein
LSIADTKVSNFAFAGRHRPVESIISTYPAAKWPAAWGWIASDGGEAVGKAIYPLPILPSDRPELRLLQPDIAVVSHNDDWDVPAAIVRPKRLDQGEAA